jgi:type 1 glutamine amidotransferase
MRRITTFPLLACLVLLAAGTPLAAEALPPATAAKPPVGDAAETLLPVPQARAKEAPPARSRAEVEALLKGADEKAPTRAIHVVLVAGKKDHGPGEHDYPAWQKAWAKLLSRAAKTQVTTAWEKPGAEDFKTADVMVLFKHAAWPKELNPQVDAYFARGGGMVLLHYAVDAGGNAESVGRHIGLRWGPGARFRHGWVELSFEAKSDSPILRGLAGRKLRFHDETYWRLTGDVSGIQVLATAVEKEKDGEVTIPLLWNRRTGKGRLHVNILGHYNWTFNDPLFRILVLRAVAWAAGEPVDRFNDLATAGVALKD